MQSKAAKIIFVALIVVAGIGFFWLKNYGPDAFSHNETRKRYQSYVKAEATIVSQDGNGYVGKNAHTIWTLQYMDKENNLQTVTMQQNSLMPKDNGEKIIIYYNPEDPKSIATEENYNEVMN